MKVTKVLSIDGGGIRGIIPAMVLEEIERKMGKNICQLFDLISGTSTGGILALGLVRPDLNGKPQLTAKDLREVYENDGKIIFKKSVFRKIITLGGLINSRYSAKNIEAILQKYFGETYLGEALTNTLITGYEIERRLPFFLKSHKARNIPDYNFKTKDIARSTSAAPTYFPPSLVNPDDKSDYYSLIDGGVYANNPAMCAYVEALTLFPETRNVFLLSLGTGEQTKRIPYSKA